MADDANPVSLSFEGLDIGDFSSDKTDYTYSLGFYERLRGTIVTMTATFPDGATWTANRSDENKDVTGHQMSIDGDDVIVVTVTSQDKDNARVYQFDPEADPHHRRRCPGDLTAGENASNFGAPPVRQRWSSRRYRAELMTVQREFSTSPGPAQRPQTKVQSVAAGVAAELEATRKLVDGASRKLAHTRGTVTQHGVRGTSPEQNAMNLDETLTALVELLDGIRDHLSELGSLFEDLADV